MPSSYVHKQRWLILKEPYCPFIPVKHGMSNAQASIYAYPRGNDGSSKYLSVQFLAQWYTRSPSHSPCRSRNLSAAHCQLHRPGFGQKPLNVLFLSFKHVRWHTSFDCVFKGVIHRICRVIKIRDTNSDIPALSIKRNLKNVNELRHYFLSTNRTLLLVVNIYKHPIMHQTLLKF